MNEAEELYVLAAVAVALFLTLIVLVSRKFRSLLLFNTKVH